MTLGDFERVANELIRVKEENQELKKQLEVNQKDIKDLDNQRQIAFENMQLNQLEVCNILRQQKEFIKYLEDEIEQNTPNVRWKHYNEDGFNDYDVENPTCIKAQPTDKILKEILQKYKKIIGDDK